MNKFIAGLLIAILLVILFFFKKQEAKKDWSTLKDLESRLILLKTKEETEEYYKEFKEKSKFIHNQFIRPRLMKIEGYLECLMRQHKIEE